ncbi:MAG: hypothetical protein J0L93_09305 [Deltaproteobacteria bacterium]|nr:hypothetical protein [Deltaproteobacteria bacterium]
MSVLTSFSAFAGSTKKNSFEFEMAEGYRYFKKYDDETSSKHFEAARKLKPNDFDAQLMLLRTTNNIGQNLRDSGADPQLVEAHFKKNVLLAEALNKSHPERAEGPFSLAIAYGNLALFSSAREKVRLSQNIEANLKKSIELNPQFPFSHLGLGIFYREVSRITFLERFFANLLFGKIPHATLEDAEQNFKSSLELEPNFLFTHYHYGICLEYADKTDEAIAEYQKVVDLPQTDSQDPRLKRLAKKALDRLQPTVIRISVSPSQEPTDQD